MKRRIAMQWAAGMAALATGACGGGGGNAGEPPTPPPPPPPSGGSKTNFLIIAIDDLNEWVGFLGNTQVKTPALDALAARATVLERAYCTAPVCAASRAGALSGLNVAHTGVKALETTFKAANPGKRQFDEMLAAAGYSVQRIGKVDHDIVGRVPQPLPTPSPYTNKECFAPAGEGAFDWGPAPKADADQPDYQYASRAIDFIKAQSNTKPFCLSLGLVRTHVAWYVPQRFFDMYPLSGITLPNVPANDLDDLGPMGKKYALMYNFHECIQRQDLWASAVQAYLASISWVDSQIARVLAALDASPHAASTMVVLWSDHGFHLGEKFHWHKQALWEHCTRVPMLIRSPGQTVGVRQKGLVSLADMAPTVLAQAGVSGDYAMDGRNLLPLLQTPSRPWDAPVVTTLDGVHHSLRTPEWRYIRYQSGERELYDELNDSGEYINLASRPEHAALMAKLDALLPPA